jgi:hypothetical protein
MFGWSRGDHRGGGAPAVQARGTTRGAQGLRRRAARVHAGRARDIQSKLDEIDAVLPPRMYARSSTGRGTGPVFNPDYIDVAWKEDMRPLACVTPGVSRRPLWKALAHGERA